MLLLVFAVSLLVWPVSAVLAYVLLHSSKHAWTPHWYALIVLLLLQFPVLALARKRAIEGGSRLTRRGKWEIIVPPALISLLLLVGISYFWLKCSSSFSC